MKGQRAVAGESSETKVNENRADEQTESGVRTEPSAWGEGGVRTEPGAWEWGEDGALCLGGGRGENRARCLGGGQNLPASWSWVILFFLERQFLCLLANKGRMKGKRKGPA